MATWSGRGLRGSTLEDLINYTIEHYRSRHLALIQKIPTPIKPIEIDKQTRHITLAYFDQKSTVDYIGVVQGIPVCFDAKECAENTFPMQNVHAHQIQFMEDFEAQEGIAFILLYYTGMNRMFYVPYREIRRFWDRAQNGGRKSFQFEEMTDAYEISVKGMGLVPFLDALQQDLLTRS